MSKRKPRTRPLYRDRYNREDAATYRPRGTKEQVRRQMESEATYATAADAIADMRRAFDAGSAVLSELLGRVMAVEAEQARLGEDLAQLDAAVETLVERAAHVEQRTEARLRAHFRLLATLSEQMKRMDRDGQDAGQGLDESVAGIRHRVQALEAVVLINSHPAGTFAPQKTSTPESDVDDVLTIGGRRPRK